MGLDTRKPLRGLGSSFVFGLTLLLVLAVMLPLVAVPLDWQGQTLVSLLLFAFAWITARRMQGRRWATLVLIGLSIFLTSRYAYWRFTETLGFGDPRYGWVDHVATFALLGAEVYAWIILFLGYIQTARPLNRKPVPIERPLEDWPHVDVYIPTYNEPLSVVEPTIIAALHIDWPRDKLHVHVLDDGTREEFRAFAERVGAGYIIRAQHTHAKAGNLNHAMTQTKGEFIAIFDCDHVPARSFLQVTMGWMLRDPKIALLQTPHHFYSPDPFERNLGLFHVVPNEGELFYGIVQDGNDLWDATFFCGSCAVMRRDALEGIGGIAVETVTEDAHTALKLQRLGWRTAYLNIPQAAGLATENLASHVGQRIRWARGMTQIFRIDNPLFGRGLSIWQRLCYLNAMAHFLFSIPRLVFLTAPLAFLLLDLRVLSAYALTFAAYSLPHLVLANMTNSIIQGSHRHSFWSEVYETVLAPYILLPTLLALINPKLGKFNVTAKGGLIEKAYFDRRIARPYMILWGLNFAGLVAAAVRLGLGAGEETATVWMTALWTVYNMVIIGAVLAVAREQRQLREHVRVPLAVPVALSGPGGLQPARTLDMSDGGLSLRSLDPQRPLAFEEGSELVLDWSGETHHLPVRWVAGDGASAPMRLAFRDLQLPERVNVVRLLYTRADAWLGLGESREPDRPLASLGLLARLAWRGSRGMVASLFGGRSTRPAAALLAACLAGLAGGPAAVEAAPARRSAPPVEIVEPAPPPGPGFTGQWTLAQMGLRQGLRLTGVNGQQALYFDVPQEKLVRSASVTVRLRHSPALLAKLSQINVYLNGSLQATYAVPASAEGAAAASGKLDTRVFEVPLDVYALKGSNSLSFQLLGHYTLTCEDPAHSALWAEILPDTLLRLEGSLLRLSDRLRRLPAPFLQRLGQGQPEPVQVQLPANPGGPVLEAAGIVASWIGTTARNATPRFRVAEGAALPRGHVIALLSAASGLPAWAEALGLPQATGPMLLVRDHPVDRGSSVLLLYGRHGEDLRSAAQALALGQHGLAGDETLVRELNLPAPRGVNDAPRWAPTHRPLKLGELVELERLQVSNAGYVNVPFQLPPDLFFWNRRSLPLTLAYTYNPTPLGKQSALTVNVNDLFAGSSPLSGALDAASKAVEYTIGLPTDRLYPQDNKLDIYFGFQIAKEGECKDTTPDTLRGALLADSQLDLVGVPHFIQLPNLAVFGNGGFPYARQADFARTAVVMAETVSPGAASLFLGLMAHWGGQTGYPALRLSVLSPAEVAAQGDKDLIVFGEPGRQPLLSSWGEHLPLRVGSAGGVQQQELVWSWSRLARLQPWWQTVDGEVGAGALGQLLGQGVWPQALIQQIVSPLNGQRSASLLIARDAEGWNLLAHALLDGEARAGVFGNVSVLTGDGKTRSFIVDAPTYTLGELPLWTWLSWRLHHAPWVLAAVVAAVALLQAFIVGIWLRRRGRRRLGEAA